MTKDQVGRTFQRVRNWLLSRPASIPVPAEYIEKDVTRRNGWEFLVGGEQLGACEKCQGLGPGGKIVRMGVIMVLDARREPLRRMLDEPEYGKEECRREGFPEMTPAEFVEFFCKGHKGVTPDSIITRIEFAYGDAEAG